MSGSPISKILCHMFGRLIPLGIRSWSIPPPPRGLILACLHSVLLAFSLWPLFVRPWGLAKH